jgi:hypothetical protein
VETLPGRHPFVALQGVVPCLSGTAEVIGCQPRTIRSQGALAAKKLLALIEPVQRVDDVIERRKVQLVEARRGRYRELPGRPEYAGMSASSMASEVGASPGMGGGDP